MARSGTLGNLTTFRVFPLQVGQDGCMLGNDAELIVEAKPDIKFLLDLIDELVEKTDAKD